jgi:isopenicillin N synthase-like dioxygenase
MLPAADLNAMRGSDAMLREKAIHDLGSAMSHFGMCRIINHEVRAASLDAALVAASDAFALPEPIKAVYGRRPEVDGLVGYLKVPQKSYNAITYEDVEMWQINGVADSTLSTSRMPRNVWPTEIPGFAASGRTLFAEFYRSASLVLEGCATYLDERSDIFTSLIEQGWSTLRYMRYPEGSRDIPAGALRADRHTDVSLLTILSRGSVEGLEVQEPDGTWLPVDGSPDELIVVGGQMLEVLSDGALKAAYHRVRYPAAGAIERLTFPFFVLPRPDVVIQPVVCSAPKSSAWSGQPMSTVRFICEGLKVELPAV